MKKVYFPLLGMLCLLITTLPAAETKKPAFDKFFGKVTGVNSTSQLVTVKNSKKNLEESFSINSDTPVLLRNEKKPFSDLKEGQYVIVYYTSEQDQKIAKRITIRPNRFQKK